MDIIFCAGYRAEKINCKEWVKKTAVSSYTGGLHAILHRLYSGTLAALQMWAILWLVPDRVPLSCTGYFNSGVLLMDVDVFRQKGLVRAVLDYRCV